MAKKIISATDKFTVETCPECKSNIKYGTKAPLDLPEQCPNCLAKQTEKPIVDNNAVADKKAFGRVLAEQARMGQTISMQRRQINLLNATVVALLERLGVNDLGQDIETQGDARETDDDGNRPTA